MLLGLGLSLGNIALRAQSSEQEEGTATPLGIVATPTVGAPAIVSVDGIVPVGIAASPTVGAPSVSGWPDSGLTSDNFESGTLGGHWTETTGGVTGGWSFGNDGTQYWMRHTLDTANYSGSGGARRMQAANNVDFQVEMQLTAALPSASTSYHYCGIYIEQDSNDRIEAQIGLHTSGTVRFIGCENIVNGTDTVPIADLTGVTGVGLRVTRIGDEWTIDYTTDGSTWVEFGSFTRAFTVAKIGLSHGQNATDNHVVNFDYFETADAPLASGEDS